MNKLKQLRKKEKLTQGKIAKYIGVTQQAYSYFETEQSKPSLETAKKIADFLKFQWKKFFLIIITINNCLYILL